MDFACIKWNVEAYFRDDPAVSIAGDNLLYPNPTDPTDRQAPDVYVAFGRPKGYRGSYKLWEEANIFPQVIFEVWSPNNTAAEMDRQAAVLRVLRGRGVLSHLPRPSRCTPKDGDARMTSS